MSDYLYTIEDTIGAAIEQVLMDTYTSIPAIIDSYDAAKQTATVTVAVDTPTSKGANIPAATYEDILIIFPSGSDWVMAGPLRKGDGVILIAPHYGTESYSLGDGGTGSPTNSVRHTLNDAVAFVGSTTYSKPKLIQALSDKLHIADKNSYISLGEDLIEINADVGVVIKKGTNSITINSTGIIINGDVTITGNVATVGTLTNNAINVGGLHTHPYTDDGNPLFTGTPV